MAPYPTAPPRAAVPYRRHGGAVHLAILTATLVTVIEMVQIPLAVRVNSSVFLDDNNRERVDSAFGFWAYAISAFLLVAVLVLAYVANCWWLWRARSNADILAPTAQGRARGWVWGAWICPVVSFWFPFQVVRDVSVADAQTPHRRTVVGWWWASFLLMFLVDRVTAAVASDDTLRLSVAAEVAEAVCTVTALALWIRVVLMVVRVQDAAGRARGLL